MKIAIIQFFPAFSGKTGPQIRIFLDQKITPCQRRSQQKKVQLNRSRRSWMRAKTILWLIMIIIKASKTTLVHYMNEGWLTNWGIQKFFPWRPLKIEKKVFGKKVVSWQEALHAIEKKILSRTASTQPPKNQILWCKNFLSSSTKSGWHFFLAKNDDISRPYDLKNWVRIFSLVVLSSIYIGASYIKF